MLCDALTAILPKKAQSLMGEFCPIKESTMFSMRTLAAGLLLLTLAPTAARADGLITPLWGRQLQRRRRK